LVETKKREVKGWKTKGLLTGGAVGATVGAVAGPAGAAAGGVLPPNTQLDDTNTPPPNHWS